MNYDNLTKEELVAAYNARAEKPRKNFPSKASVVAALVALDAVRPAEPIPAPVAETPRARRRKAFNWPAKDEIKPHRAGTKRAWVVETLTGPGATFEEVAERCGWDRPTAYEGIKLIHVLLGYGLVEDPETGVIRAFTRAA